MATLNMKINQARVSNPILARRYHSRKVILKLNNEVFSMSILESFLWARRAAHSLQ